MAKEKGDLKDEVIEIPSSVSPEEKKEPKKEKVTLKKPEKTEKTEKAEEDVETLPGWAKTRLEKLESDNENYKKGMLKYKKFSLKSVKEKPKEEEEEPELDETSKKFQKQILSKAEKRAEAKATDIVEGYNEKVAISRFLKKNPGLEENWDEIVSNYVPKNGKETSEAITKDLNRALLLTHYESGDLDKLQAEASKKGEKKGAAQAKLAEMVSVSKTTSKVGSKSSTLSASALQMAEKMRVDRKDLAKEDDSSTAEIKL